MFGLRDRNCRLGEVILLDGRRVEILIQPRLFAGDLFDMVASHFNLKEKEYFGLAFLDETGQYSWLNLERRVLEHEYAQKIRPVPKSTVEEDAISMSTIGTTKSLTDLGEVRSSVGGQSYSSTTRNRRIGDLKKKKSQSQGRMPFKKGSLSNLSGSLRAKLNGANGVLSRLMSSTTSLPTAAASERSASPGAHITSRASSKHNSISSASIDLSPLDATSATQPHFPSEDPLYDVIHEEDDYQDGRALSKLTNGHSHCEPNYSELQLPNGKADASGQGSHINSRSSLQYGDQCSIGAAHSDHEVTSVFTDDDFVGAIPNDYDLDELSGDMAYEEMARHENAEEENRLVLYFLVKYFVESISMLHDTTTIELFFLQAKSLLINETVQVDLDTNLTLLALILQSLYGDISSESKARNRVHKLQLISSYLLQELTTSCTCEERILEQYRKLSGISRAEAIYQFMTLIEKQPTYGVHFYEVKDKSGAPYWLGLSVKGISQFEYEDRRLPRRQFPWKQLENLYFREKKFSIEVRDPKRVVHTLSSINLYENAIEDVNTNTFDDLSSAICDPTTQVSVSRRTFGPCNVTVYVWFAASSSLTKCIWSMAISQHQFYIDRRLNKCHLISTRTPEDIVKSLADNLPRSIVPPRRHSISSAGSRRLIRRFSSLGSIHSNNSTHSSTHSLHSLSRASSSASSSALSLNQLWDASDSSSVFSSFRTQPGSLKMSRTQSRSSKSLCFRRLRLLETQLNAKLEEIKKLDLLEQQILQRAAKSAVPEHVPAMTRSNQLQLASDQSSSSSSSTCSAPTSGHRPVSTPPIASANSLKSFVVTGRVNSTGLSSTLSSDGSASQSSPSQSSHSSGVTAGYAPYSSAIDPSQVNHQRSRSVGVASKFSLDRTVPKKPNPEVTTTMSGDRHTGSASIIPSMVNSEQSKPKPSSTLPASRQTVKQLPTFTSPYVNKYDTSVQDGTNLYSVPNRRTSIALNSFDDSFLKPTRPLNASTAEPGKFMFQFTTTAVTSNVNSLTLSTVSYRYEQRMSPSLGYRPAPPRLTPTPPSAPTENVYATIGPPAQPNVSTVQTADFESSVDEIDSLPAPPLHLMYPPASTMNSQVQSYQTPAMIRRSIDEDNLAHYRSLLTRSSSFGSGQHQPRPVPNLKNQQAPASYSQQMRAQTESIYSNYANIGPLAINTSHSMSPSPHLYVENSPNAGQHQYQNAQSILSQLNSQQQLQQASPSAHIYQSLSPVSTFSNSTTASVSHKKPAKTWFETDLDFPTGYVRSKNVDSNSTFISSAYLGNTSSAEETPKPVSYSTGSNAMPPDSYSMGPKTYSHGKINSHLGFKNTAQPLTPAPLAERESSVDQEEDEAEFPVSSVAPVLSDFKTSTFTAFAQPTSVPVLATAQSFHQPQASFSSSLYGYAPSSARSSLVVSPSPSNLSSASSSASSFFANHGASTSGHHTNLTPTKAASSKSTLTPTGSVLSLSLGAPLSPVCTVAFVPSVAGQDAVSVAPSGTLGGSTASSSQQAVPIASCKGNIVEVDVVTVGHFQPGYEEEKPFTISDYYKYSQKYRNANKAVNSTAKPNAAAAQSVASSSDSSAAAMLTNGQPKQPNPVAVSNKNEPSSELISRFGQMNMQPVEQSLFGLHHPRLPYHQTSSPTTTACSDDNNNNLPVF